MASILNATTTSGLVTSADNSGSLQLQTNNGTTAVTIDTSQNVGIGTSSPATKVDINGGGVVRVSTNDTNSTTKESKYVIRHYTNSEEDPMIVYAYSDSTDNQIIYGGGSSAQNSATVHRFFTSANNTTTSGTERMRITSGGRLAIGSTTTTFPLYVKLSGDSGDWFAKFENTVGSAAYGCWINYSALSPNGAGNEFLYISDSTAQRLSVRSNGGIANYSANDVNLSDEREKTNIQLAGSYLDKICAIPVKTFNYIDQNREEDDGLTLGVIAQDVQKVAPELVMESNWAAKDEPEKMRLSIYQTDLQYALMKCIQEQQAQIEELKAEVQALKGAA